MNLPQVDQEYITILVDSALREGEQLGSVYIRPMIQLIEPPDLGIDENEEKETYWSSDSAKWPEPWGHHDLGERHVQG